LALFAVVGATATVIDLGLFAVLWWWGLDLVPADVVALAAAAAVSYAGNRYVTFRHQPGARWVNHPALFAAMALLAGAVDIGALVSLSALGLPVPAAKVAALAAAALVRFVTYRRILFRQVRRDLSARSERGAAPGDRRLSVVIPAFGEQDRIGDTLRRLRHALEVAVPADDLELLVVDDGSPDDTAGAATRAGADRVVRLERNRGKGAAVRAGMLTARGRSVVFTDADLAYPPSSVIDVLTHLEEGWDMVAGSRRHTETTTLVKARRLRELGGRMVNLFTHLVLLGNFRDTQCGIKGFRSDVARSMFARTRIDGFAFDVELFLIAEQDRLSVLEVPVQVQNRASSSVRLVRDTSRLVADLLRIRRWAGRGYYRTDRPGSDQLPAPACG
jgi:dolichyl-phosphate beta-glucosyltransferase